MKTVSKMHSVRRKGDHLWCWIYRSAFIPTGHKVTGTVLCVMLLVSPSLLLVISSMCFCLAGSLCTP